MAQAGVSFCRKACRAESKERIGLADGYGIRNCASVNTDRSRVVMSKIMLLAVLASLTGCLSTRPTGMIIPARCVRVSVQSFTQPCSQRPDGKFVCDRVVISASCVAPPPMTASTAQ